MFYWFNLDILSVSVCGMFGLQSAMFANIRTSSFWNSKTTSATTTTAFSVNANSVNGYHCLLVTSAFRGHLQAFLSLPMSDRSPIPIDFTSIILFLMFIYFWERERESECMGGAERDRDKESEASFRLWAVNRAPHRARTHELSNHDLSRSWMSDRLSHAGTLHKSQ